VTEAPGPPTGTVTCLFSDIEGSTRLELDLGTGPYRDVLERHRVLLRGAFTAHAGHEQATEGDSFFVIFRAAPDAVAAAVDGQRALAAESWPDGADVQVRMGLNTGDVETLGPDVVGYAINRAARITSAGHGGQVLLGETTRTLVGGNLPTGVTLRELGPHRLKDLSAAESLAQLIIDGLRYEFPPLRTLDRAPHNLPVQLTGFVGRELEVAEARELLSRTRLLTMTGPGGTGKTRLSLQVASECVEDYPGGLWFVALETVRDAELVAPTIARAMHVTDKSMRSAMEILIDFIGDRRMLLVLDNFEQVVGAGPVIAELLRGAPNLAVIATSRAPLRISGEQEYPVPGLPAPPDLRQLSEVDRLNLPRALREYDLETLGSYESVQLFVARAMAVRPDFTVTAANAPAVAQICARLYGMPLAIELAAARVKLLAPDQILARLDHHLAILTAGSRDLPERQQTLRGAIAWSYDLLDEAMRRLVDRLSVFRGGFDLETAEAVCGSPAELGLDLFDGLETLVDQSLIRVEDVAEGPPRFVMLDTIAEFAGEMLAARGETDRIAERHARAFLDLAERAAPHLSGADQRTWLDRLERDHDNLRAALDWATGRPEPEVAARLAFALWRFWQQRGYLREARARFDRMSAMGWDLEPDCAARFAEAFGGIAYWQSDQETAALWYDRALAIRRELGDPGEIANALYNRAYADMVVIMAGRATPDLLERSRGLMEESLALSQEVGDRAGEGNAIWGLGSYHYFTADAATAEDWYRRALSLHREAGHRTMEAWSLHMLALTVAAQRKWEEARAIASHALQHFHEAGDVAGVTLVLDDLAIVALGTGDVQRAGRIWGAARHLQQSTGTALADYVQQTVDLFGVPNPRDALTPDELAALAGEGAAMSLDDIVAYALDGVPGEAHRDDADDPAVRGPQAG
jgi:predicted ATPase/class 3 adenylate cyclase